MSNLSTLIPKLWFDIYSQEGPASEGQCDCDGACPNSIILEEGNTLPEFFMHQLKTEGMQDIFFNQDTFLNRVGPHSAVLNAKGRLVVVLDDQACQLFSCLPCTQEELRTQLSEWSTEVFERVIALLFAVNVLSSPQIEYDDTVQSKSDTLVALLHLTSRCNLSCAYCYVTQTNQRMDISTAQHAVDAVFRSALTHGYTRVKLKYAGGEPTLHFEALQAAQQRAEELGSSPQKLYHFGLCLL